ECEFGFGFAPAEEGGGVVGRGAEQRLQRGRRRNRLTPHPGPLPVEGRGRRRRGRFAGWGRGRNETAFGVVAKERSRAAFAGADDEVVPAVAVEIDPGDAGAELAELSFEGGLALEIVERKFVMGVAQKRADVGEERRESGRMGEWESGSIGWFRDFVEA